MNITAENTVGELVAKDYRIASVLAKYNIDFCCKGNRKINDVCEELKIDPGLIAKEISNVSMQADYVHPDYWNMPVEALAEHIQAKHHKYVEEQIPVLKGYLTKICQVHGPGHQELFKVYKLFSETAGELAMHMKKEEFILFPYIKKMAKVKGGNEKLIPPSFQTVENPVQMMMNEHSAEGERFEEISRLTDAYTPPHDACNTYRLTYRLLKEFEQDLHLHIHLENNILFPKAIEMERLLFT